MCMFFFIFFLSLVPRVMLSEQRLLIFITAVFASEIGSVGFGLGFACVS